MREILFRGKRLDKGEWIAGCLVKYAYDSTPYIGYLDAWGDGIYKVDPSTVGQYTGLPDKNGKKIFEGHIVHILGDQESADWKGVNYNALIAFLDGGFCAIDGTIEEHGFRRYALARMDFDLEIIGNKWDNPELLEE